MDTISQTSTECTFVKSGRSTRRLTDLVKGEIGDEWFFETPEVKTIEEELDFDLPRRRASAPAIKAKKALKLATLMSNFNFDFDTQSCNAKQTPDFGNIATPSTCDSSSKRRHFFPEQPRSYDSFMALFGEQDSSSDKTALPSLNAEEPAILVNSKQVKAIKKLREKREKQLNRMGLALNQENYRLLTVPKREKNASRSAQAKAIKRNEEGVFVKSVKATKATA